MRVREKKKRGKAKEKGGKREAEIQNELVTENFRGLRYKIIKMIHK